MKTKLVKFSVLTIFTLFLLNSCGWYKRSDIKDNPVNVDERVKKTSPDKRIDAYMKLCDLGYNVDTSTKPPEIELIRPWLLIINY